MKFQSSLIVVEDIARSRAFYEGLLGQKVESDYGANVCFGGFSIQQRALWQVFIGEQHAISQGKAHRFELYFEEEEMDAFLQRLSEAQVECLAPPMTHSWGQRVVRFYDPDGYLVEVGESMEMVVCRFLQEGYTKEQAAQKTQQSLAFVQQCQERMQER